MCEAIGLENMIVDRIEQAAAILGRATMVRHPDNLFDDDLTNEYGHACRSRAIAYVVSI
jgi:aryl-alcohol dehydrogenase-like predicted oxidoreductase